MYLFIPPPADSTPEVIEQKHGETPANFQIPRYPVWLQCISPRGPMRAVFSSILVRTGTHVASVWSPVGDFGHTCGSLRSYLRDSGNHSEPQNSTDAYNDISN